MKRTLVTGFQAFGGDDVNPTELMLKWIQEDPQLSQIFETQLLPVEYGAHELILNRPDLDQFENIFSFGLAAGRSKVSLERLGLNWVESRSADNAGVVPPQTAIDPRIGSAIINEMNLDELKKYFEAQSIPTEISLSAGGYVCNHLYFHLLKARLKAEVLFIHVPYLESQVIEKSKSPQLKSIEEVSAAGGVVIQNPAQLPFITEASLKKFLKLLAEKFR